MKMNQILSKDAEQWYKKIVVPCMHGTDRNILEDSCQLVKHFPDFPLWEYRIASFNAKLFIKGSNSELTEREIWEMFY